MAKYFLILFLLFQVVDINAQSKVSTASRNVRIIDTAFNLPELGRTRRIWIYLPQGRTDTKYPVIYLQDGQNLFDERTSFAGEWGIDEFMDTVSLRKCIVVGIDNGGMKRVNEYSPYDMEKYGKGEGDAYLNFIVNRLKPYIDQNFPSLADRKHTLIGGSSLGALISYYAMLKYPRIFGGAMLFSPSFWIAPAILDATRKYGRKMNGRIYFYAGKHESEDMVTDMLKVLDEIKKFRRVKATVSIREEGKHNEATWRKEFPLFYNWYFGRSVE